MTNYKTLIEQFADSQPTDEEWKDFCIEMVEKAEEVAMVNVETPQQRANRQIFELNQKDKQ